MRQIITIDDALLKSASYCLATDDINEVVNIERHELIKNHPVANHRRRQPPASIAGKGKILADLVTPCVDSEDFECLE